MYGPDPIIGDDAFSKKSSTGYRLGIVPWPVRIDDHSSFIYPEPAHPVYEHETHHEGGGHYQEVDASLEKKVVQEPDPVQKGQHCHGKDK